LHTLTQQTYGVENFEVIVIDDNSEDDVDSVVAPYVDQLDIKVHHLTHNFGMRGNTVSLNTAFGLAQGDILFENTPEIMLYPQCIEDMVQKLCKIGGKGWVSVRTKNLVAEDQLLIDTVDWMRNIRNIEILPNFNCPWTMHNTKKTFFGTHQTCATYRSSWYHYMGRFPFFLDYGTDDPWYSGRREEYGFISETITPFVYHQWHAPIGFWMAFDRAPNWNKWGHTMKNHYNDPLVWPNGTGWQWDRDQEGGYTTRLSEADKDNWKGLLSKVENTGFPAGIRVKPEGGWF